MRTSFLIFIFLFSLTNCKDQNKDYLFEDKLLSCFESEYTEFELNKVINDLEKIYIKYGLLKDKSSKSKMIFFQEMNETDSVKNGNNKNLITEISSIKLLPLLITCSKINELISKDSLLFYHSRLNIVSENISISLSNSKDIFSTRTISNSILNIVTEEDFNHKYYKFLFFSYSRIFYQEQDWGILDMLEKEND